MCILQSLCFYEHTIKMYNISVRIAGLLWAVSMLYQAAEAQAANNQSGALQAFYADWTRTYDKRIRPSFGGEFYTMEQQVEAYRYNDIVLIFVRKLETCPFIYIWVFGPK